MYEIRFVLTSVPVKERAIILAAIGMFWVLVSIAMVREILLS